MDQWEKKSGQPVSTFLLGVAPAMSSQTAMYMTELHTDTTSALMSVLSVWPLWLVHHLRPRFGNTSLNVTSLSSCLPILHPCHYSYASLPSFLPLMIFLPPTGSELDPQHERQGFQGLCLQPVCTILIPSSRPTADVSPEPPLRSTLSCKTRPRVSDLEPQFASLFC